MRRDMMLAVAVGVVAGLALSAAAFLSKPIPAFAQATTTPLPAPSCAVAGTGSPAAPAAFACAADLNGGGRQEVIVGYPTNGGAATYRAVIISENGKITQLNY
jgi:hypothetical protein